MNRIDAVVPSMRDAILGFCVLWALTGPLVSPWVERRLGTFMVVLGITAAAASGAWSEALVAEAFLRPMKVCGAVLAGSLLFSFSHDGLKRAASRAMERLGPRPAVAACVALVGLGASVLTMPVAALALVELLTILRLERESEVHVAVLACFAIGLGGSLTPLGGPVPALAAAKLAANPGMGFSGLAWMMGPWLVTGVAAVAASAAVVVRPAAAPQAPAPEDPLSLWTLLVLSGRLYALLAGLVLLGGGLAPWVDSFLLDAPPGLLYWANAVSAAVDGATLVSMELSPRMSGAQISHLLIGVQIAGGALMTGHAHSLVVAHKLGIPAREWARVGLPTAGVLMSLCFLSLVQAG